MKSYDVRIKGLYDGLTAKERALLVLRAWKEGKEEEPGWRYAMPEYQVREFHRLVGLMNGVNRQLGLLLLALHLEADKLSLRLGWLSESALWALGIAELRSYLASETKEPITESEHRALVAKARGESAPVAELAEELVYRHTGWAEADAESWDEADGLIVKPAAWARLCRRKERELARLVAQEVLQGSGKGKALTVNVGSFYDWLGEEPPVGPERGMEFEVLPDVQAEDVARRREARRRAFEELDRAPGLGALFHPGYWPEAVQPVLALQPAGKLDELVALHKDVLRAGVEEQWRQLRMVERLVAEAQEALGGEDPCVPEVRRTLDHTKERLAEIHQSLREYVEPFALPEPDEETRAEVRALAEQSG